MDPASLQPPDEPRPHHSQATPSGHGNVGNGAESNSGGPGRVMSSPRPTARELPNTPRTSRYASPTPFQDSLNDATRSILASPFALPGLIEPDLFPAAADLDSVPALADDEASVADMASPAYATSSPPLPETPGPPEDDDSLNRCQLLNQVRLLRAQLTQVIREKDELEERRQKTLDENLRLATRLSALQQRWDDHRGKTIGGDLWPGARRR